MHTKASAPIIHLTDRTASALVVAYFELNHLKQLFRQGWLRAGIPPSRCESVAEHTYGVALLCLFLADSLFPQLDAARLVRMALLHDLAEAYAGDITPHDALDRAHKHRLEREALERIVGKLPKGDDYLALWDEYERGQSPEARLVRQVDRLEMGLQACVYELQGAGDLDPFFTSVRQALEAPALRGLLEELELLRPARTGPQ